MHALPLSYPHVSKLSPNLFSSLGDGDSFNDITKPQPLASDEKHQARVLVVDDAPDVLEMFGIMLRLSGYKVSVAASAPEALEQARATQFDVIVSDIGMPEMNGYELARRLREIPGYGNVPMIAVTGFSMFKDQSQALESGFDAHLSKPVDPVNLLELIERLRD